MKYLLIMFLFLLLFSACGSGLNVSNGPSVCGINYQEVNYGDGNGILVGKDKVEVVYRYSSASYIGDTQLEIYSGEYKAVDSNCHFEVQGHTVQEVNQTT